MEYRNVRNCCPYLRCAILDLYSPGMLWWNALVECSGEMIRE